MVDLSEHIKDDKKEFGKLEHEIHELKTKEHPFMGFDKARGFHHSDIHKAAEELRMEGKGSEDPVYESSKKNK